MIIPLTTRILGHLIEKGYTHVFAKQVDNSDDGTVTITLFPTKQKPELSLLSEEFDTYYVITQEPMQMACGIDNTTSVVVDLPGDENASNLLPDEILDDSTFRLSEDFYKQVIESLEEYAVFTTDKLGDVNSWNRGAERLLGYPENEITGANSSIFFTQKDQEDKQPEKELENAIQYGKAVDERFHVRKDGSVFWGSGLVFPLYDNYNNHRGFTKIMRNLEERKQAEQNAPETHR